MSFLLNALYDYSESEKYKSMAVFLSPINLCFESVIHICIDIYFFKLSLMMFVCFLSVCCSSPSWWGSSGISCSFMHSLLQLSLYHRSAVSWASKWTKTSTLAGLQAQNACTQTVKFVHTNSAFLRFFSHNSELCVYLSVAWWWRRRYFTTVTCGFL